MTVQGRASTIPSSMVPNTPLFLVPQPLLTRRAVEQVMLRYFVADRIARCHVSMSLWASACSSVYLLSREASWFLMPRSVLLSDDMHYDKASTRSSTAVRRASGRRPPVGSLIVFAASTRLTSSSPLFPPLSIRLLLLALLSRHLDDCAVRLFLTHASHLRCHQRPDPGLAVLRRRGKCTSRVVIVLHWGVPRL